MQYESAGAQSLRVEFSADLLFWLGFKISRYFIKLMIGSVQLDIHSNLHEN
jgi:hypothetical protein